MEKKEKLKNLFIDTIYNIEHNEELKQKTFETIDNTLFYSPLIGNVITKSFYPKLPSIKVVNERSFDASKEYVIGKTMILNFASAIHPGGGVLKGSMAQEECLCRSSNLFPCLNQNHLLESFYLKHKSLKNQLYSDRAIYTPNITIFKTDETFPKMLEENEWRNVDVLTIAAPNLIDFCIDKDTLYKVLYNRILQILSIAYVNHVDNLILGAFGCGAFKNPPELVAECFYQLLIENKIAHSFKNIKFAIFVAKDSDIKNLKIFQNKFK